MITVLLNGKDISHEDLNILISRNAVTGEETVRMYSGFEEINMSSLQDHIEVSIDVCSKKDLPTLYEDSKLIDESVHIIEQALEVVRREIESIHGRHLKIKEELDELLTKDMERDERDKETVRKIILQNPAAFKGISAGAVSVAYMVDRLIEMYRNKEI